MIALPWACAFRFAGRVATGPRWGIRAGSPLLLFALLALSALAAPEAARAEDSDEERRCLEFVRADQVGRLGGAVDVTGDTHTIRRKWKSPRGWDADILVSWAAPPKRVCGGDTFSLRMDVKNFKPHAKDPGGYAAQVFFGVGASFCVDLQCTDSDARNTDNCGVYVMIPDDGGWAVANATIKVPNREVGLEFMVFHVSLTLDSSVSVEYLYRIVPRKATDKTKHHDLIDPHKQTDVVLPESKTDTDKDGLTDEEEKRLRTDPLDPDTDDDGKSDGQEVKEGTDPLVPSVGINPDQIGPATDPCRDLGPGTWVVIGSRSAAQGTKVRVPVSLCAAERLGDFNLTIRYDTAVLRATGFSPGALVANALFDVNLQPPGTIRLGMADDPGVSGSGVLAYLDFDVIGEEGSSSLLSGAVTSSTQGDDDRALSIRVKNGLVEVVAADIPGDGNKDKRITSLDALMALRMSIGKLPVDLVLDVNGDGEVTALDARWILQAATGRRKLQG